MLSSIGRAAIRRVVTRGSTTSTRALLNQRQRETSLSPFVVQVLRRSYVAASSTTVGSKKAKATSTKSAPKRASSKKRTSKKPVAKKTRKIKPKTKAKAKPKVKKLRKPVSEKSRARKEASARLLLRKGLYEQALIGKEPKKAPSNIWSLYISSQLPKKLDGTLADHIKAISEQYKNLSLEEKETLEKQASQNKLTNANEHKQWVEGQSPATIKTANDARKKLRKLLSKNKSYQYTKISDARQPLKPTSEFGYYVRRRFAAGEEMNMSAAEVVKQCARDWKTLSEDERQVYHDLHAVERERYIQEFRTVFGKDPKMLRK